jgi:membrane peptidoglycan carboxypeptidase
MATNLSKGKTERFIIDDEAKSKTAKRKFTVDGITNSSNIEDVNLLSDSKADIDIDTSSQYEVNNLRNAINPKINDKFLLEDDVFKEATKKILPRGFKNNTIFNKVIPSKKANGSTGAKKPPLNQNLSSLKSKFGFNWQRLGRRFAVAGIVFLIFSLLFFSVVATWAINRYNDAPNISENNLFNIKETSVVYARDGKTKIFDFFDKDGKKEYVNLDRIPEVMQLAILGLEDENFYYNTDGIPWSNILGAIVDCFKGGLSDCRGGSGLAQQLVKTVNKDNESSVERKIRELFTAIKLYNEGTKEDGKRVNRSDVLELYLNWVAFSRNSQGVQAASKSYFGHDIDARENPSDPNSPYLLTPPKACYLAALVQNPTIFGNSINNQESPRFKQFSSRKDICLEKLAGDSRGFSLRGDGKPLFISTQDELQNWKDVNVEFISTRIEDPFPHFREYVQGEIVKFLESIGLSEQDLYRRGLRIITTLDPDIQKKTEEVIKGAKDELTRANANNAAGTVIDGSTGEIIAMVGSVDYNDTSIDGNVNVLLTPQQPGSSIKPIVYANLFEKGFNPGTVLMDTKTNFIVDPKNPRAIYSPDNFTRIYSGPRTIHYSLSNSLNIPAVKAGYMAAGTGNYDLTKALDAFFGFSEKIGDRFPCYPGIENGCEDPLQSGPKSVYRRRCYSASFIGGCEIQPLAHATAINTLLQEGNLRTASPFISIIDKFGQELYTPENRDKLYPHTDKVIKPEVARQTAWVMADQNRREFFQYQPLFTIPGWDLAAKTGTTDDNKDTWMVGGSPYYTTVIWAGRTDNQPLAPTVQAANVAAPIWQDIQKFLHENKTKKKFSTEGLKEVKLDPISGFPSERGEVQLLSDEQIKILNEAGERIAKPDYDPRKQTAFENRSAVVPRKLKINKLDGKLAVEGKTLAENVEEKVCYDFLGEFPSVSNWRDPVDAWARNNSNRCVELPNSDQDQVKDQQTPPIINIIGNLQSNQPFPSTVSINFQTGAPSKKLIGGSVKVNGIVVKSFSDPAGQDQANLNLTGEEVFAASGGISGNVTILIEVADTGGAMTTRTISNVTLQRNNNSGAGGSGQPSGNSQQISLSQGANVSLVASTDLGVSIALKLRQNGFERVICEQAFKNFISSTIYYGCAVNPANLSGFNQGPATLIGSDGTSQQIELKS